MPRPARRAMAAVDAFRRELRGIADGPAPLAEKRGRLAAWRREVDALGAGLPATPVGIALLEPMRRHGLARAELEALVGGAEMDTVGVMLAPLACDLRLYCRRTAGAMAVLGLAALGDHSPASGYFALTLGEAAALTILLRDLPHNADLNRLHLPRETLAEAGIVAASPREVLSHPALPAVCQAVAATARAAYEDARSLLADVHPAALLPCLMALDVGERLLSRLETRGWQDLETRPHLGRLELASLTLRHRVMGAA